MIAKKSFKIIMLVGLVQTNFNLLSSEHPKKPKESGEPSFYQNLLTKAHAQRAKLLAIGRNAWPEGPDFYDALLRDTNKGIAKLQKLVGVYK